MLLIQSCVDIDPDEPANMSVLIAFELDQAVPQRSRLKDPAFRNIFLMLITLDISQFEMSPSNDLAPWNILDMSLTLDTSHREMEQSHFGSILTQLSRRLLSCDLDCGIKPCGGGA